MMRTEQRRETLPPTPSPAKSIPNTHTTFPRTRRGQRGFSVSTAWTNGDGHVVTVYGSSRLVPRDSLLTPNQGRRLESRPERSLIVIQTPARHGVERRTGTRGCASCPLAPMGIEVDDGLEGDRRVSAFSNSPYSVEGGGDEAAKAICVRTGQVWSVGCSLC